MTELVIWALAFRLLPVALGVWAYRRLKAASNKPSHGKETRTTRD